MDRLSRLITLTVLALMLALVLHPLAALAQFAPPASSSWTVQNFMGSPPYGGNATVAGYCGPGWPAAGYASGGPCEGYCRNESPSSPPLSTAERNTGRFYGVGGSSGNTYTFNCGIPGTTCPSNSTLSGGSCQCNSGYTMNTAGTGCVSDGSSCPTRGANMGTRYVGPFSSQPSLSPFDVCNEGCGIRYTPDSVMQNWTGTGWYIRATGAATGTSCTGGGTAGTGATPPPPAASAPNPSNGDTLPGRDTVNTPPTPCGNGQCPGTVNGQSVCVACGSTQQQPQVTTTRDGSGNVTGGSTTSTSCSGATCTTTTTTTNASGTPTGTTTVTQRQAEYCAANPGAAVCQTAGAGGGGAGGGGTGVGSGSFGGTCAAGFTCEGDAVQCAMAREQHIKNCVLFETTTASSDAGNAAATGEAQPTGHPGATPETVDLSLSSRINQSPLFGGSTCPADVSTTVMGEAIAIPFSTMCGYLNLIGAAGVMVALLVAGFIVFRSGS